MSKSLNDTEAAQFLRITKDLLYSYSTKSTNGRILETLSNADNKFYSESNLLAWDKFLNGPWTAGTERIRPPRHIQDYLKVESEGQCSRCGNGGPFEDAHIIPWAKSKSNHHHNLLRLCKPCHKMYDDGIISQAEIKKIKEQRIQRLQETVLKPHNFNFQSLRKPPLPDRCFKGRKDEMLRVQESLSTNPLTIIHGIGGIGKTQLAIHALKGTDRSLLWFNVEQYQELQDLQLALIVEYGARSIDDLMMQIGSKNEILALDGYERLIYKNKDQAIEFIFNVLAYASQPTLLITTQIKFSDSRYQIGDVPLQKLTTETGIESLNAYTNNKYENDSILLEISFFSEGHPLTLRIIGGLLNYFQNIEQVKQLIKDRGVKSLINPERESQTKSTSLEVCLTLAYEQYDEQHQWLLNYIACFPAGIHELNLELLTSPRNGSRSIFKSKAQLLNTLGKLKLFSFVVSEEGIMSGSRLSLLNPIRIYLGELAKSQQKLIHSIQIEAFHHLVWEAFMLYQDYLLSDQIKTGIVRYEMELPNFLYAIKKSVHAAYCKKCQKYSDRKEYLFLIKAFASSLYKFLFTRGYLNYSIYINEQGAKAHIELGEYDQAVEDLVQVSSMYWRSYQYDKAKEILDEIHRCIEKSGGNNNYPPVFVLEGELIRDKEPLRAIEIYKVGIEVAQNNLKIVPESEADRGNLATLYSEIGRIYERFIFPKQPKKALEYYKIGYDIQNQMKDYANMYCNSHHIGNCYADLGNVQDALKYYTEALLGFIETGQDQYIGNSMSELGFLKCKDPFLKIDNINSGEILNNGLQGIKSEVLNTLGHNRNSQNPIFGGIYEEQAKKLFNIIKLVSFTPHTAILKTWASELLVSFGGERTTFPSYPWLFLQIAQFIPYVEKNPEDEEALNELKRVCYLFGNEVEHDIYDPFDWLSKWMQFKGIDITASRGKVFAEVERWAEEYFHDEEE